MALVAMVLVGLGSGVALAFGVVALAARNRALRRLTALEARRIELEGAGSRKEVLLQTVVDTAPIAIVLFTDAGRITFTNRSARELFFEGAVVDGQNFLSMVERASLPLRQALLSSSGELFTVEVDGGEETFHLSKQEVDGQTLIAVRNVTQEINRQDIGTLKKVIRVIAHEINNSLGPIASLLGSAKLILQRPEPIPRLAPILETIEERALHLRSFLDGYAKLAKLPQPQIATVAWAPFLEGLSGLWPELRIARSPERSGVFDRAQIQQAIINLVKNAYEAGGPSADVELAIETPPEGGARIAVLDRGKGMSDEAIQNAFFSFFTSKPGGSGLGLALCREIVELHRGRLRLARREGGGMAVSIWLPDGESGAAGLAASRARLTLTNHRAS
jgi:two-component system, NtrC family, nitrogen regulation sensor histidine kinase NtrY